VYYQRAAGVQRTSNRIDIWVKNSAKYYGFLLWQHRPDLVGMGDTNRVPAGLLCTGQQRPSSVEWSGLDAGL